MTSIKQVGASGQISIGKEHAGKFVIIEMVKPGVWTIKTASIVADDERPENPLGALEAMLQGHEAKQVVNPVAASGMNGSVQQNTGPRTSNETMPGAGEGTTPSTKL